ncbi:hypothetical protein [Microbacterium aurum]
MLLLGPSGAGKSTLALALNGLIRTPCRPPGRCSWTDATPRPRRRCRSWRRRDGVPGPRRATP